MGFLEFNFSAWVDVGIAISTLILAFVTVLTVRQMNLQQRKDRSHKEMTLLVGQLHSHQESNFLFGINLTTYGPLPDRDRTNENWKKYYDFWDNIKINMYLGDPDLLSILQNYFAAKNDYWIWVENGGHLSDDHNSYQRKIDRIKTMREALRLETNRRYEILKSEINRLEHQHYWQFWK